MEQRSLFDKFLIFTTSVHSGTHEMTQDCKPDSITPIQYSILEIIAVSDPMTLSEISDCLRISLPNASREVRKLSERNLIVKKDDLHDKRKQYIQLSEDGAKLMKDTFQCIERKFQWRIEDMSQEELEKLEEAMNILQDRVFYNK
ncbi:MarR family transcriptional regulator [Gracilibacillus oryzae]|uniref:MarR family transcriptional regulator n=1 Tax=Gracilibacillus oryzae TaxID=1672701 RepID=A0A7C8KSN1_9BACI|nr:MarR family transcriptional regulator [Gracilibacillus oryzae]